MRTQDSLACVILDESNKVLLVHQNGGAQNWTLPGGKIIGDEAVWEAAVRECREEISIDAQNPELSGLYHLSHRNAYVYVFRINEFTGVPSADGRDIDRVEFFSVDDLPYPISNHTAQRIIDALDRKTATAMREQNLAEYKMCRE